MERIAVMKTKQSKRYREVSKKLEPNKYYTLDEILSFLKENNFEKSSNIKIAFSFHWDEKKIPLRGNLLLPYPAKKLERVAIIGEELPPALQNKEGIELIGTEEIVRRISKGKKNSWGFQKLLVHSSWQEKIKPLAKILGPKKMFPNSKDGTLTDDLVKAVEEIHKGKMELRSDKDGNLHTLLGKVDFNLEQLEKNYQVLLKAVMGLKASNWKGKYLKQITFSTTMGPGMKILMN